jgi:CheY-like chemotaxis protein
MGAILIVEDDDDIRGLIADALRREGYDVLEAEHGARALEILAEQRTQPCLILLDLMMPVMSGPELLKVLRDTDRLASLPVVVVSAGGRPDEAPEARKFVRKPPNLGVLFTLAEEFCGRPPAAVAGADAPLPRRRHEPGREPRREAGKGPGGAHFKTKRVCTLQLSGQQSASSERMTPVGPKSLPKNSAAATQPSPPSRFDRYPSRRCSVAPMQAE